MGKKTIQKKATRKVSPLTLKEKRAKKKAKKEQNS
jgi:hypothetical protein